MSTRQRDFLTLPRDRSGYPDLQDRLLEDRNVIPEPESPSGNRARRGPWLSDGLEADSENLVVSK